MENRAQRARTLSEEARGEAGGDPGPCAPNLYVCGYSELKTIDDLAGVVCCEIDAVPQQPRYARFHLPLAAAAYLVQVDPERLARLVEFISAARLKGPTAIYCSHGRGRSVAVAVVYLVATGTPMREALLAVARSRPRIDCPVGTVATLERVTAAFAEARKRAASAARGGAQTGGGPHKKVEPAAHGAM